MKNTYRLFLLLFFISGIYIIKAQILPSSKAQLSVFIPIDVLPSIDHQKLFEEDKVQEKLGTPLRMAVRQKVDYSMDNSGKLDVLPDGTRIWRLEISSPGAYLIDIKLNDVNIPAEASFFIYDPTHQYILPEIKGKEVMEDTVFYSEKIPGDVLVVEYVEPSTSSFQGNFKISGVGHSYRKMPVPFTMTEKGNFGNAEGTCHPDVICPEGEGWQDQIDASVFINISSSGGDYMCSGTMLNNVRRDGKLYMLTANHCKESGAIYRAYFRYHASSCGSSSGSYLLPLSGSSIKASNNFSSSSDFMLIEMTGSVNQTIRNVIYLSGWSAENTTPSKGSGIHHPGGDFKKISIPGTVTNGSSYGYGKYWRVTWIANPNNKGTTEPGSSGSALFDDNKRVVGQLYGGESYCNTPTSPDYYGKFSNSWDASTDSAKQLKYWLDPDNTGIKVIDGMYFNQVGIEDYSNLQLEASVYPNPSTGKITLRGDFYSNTIQYQLVNITGSLIQSAEISSAPEIILDFDKLPNGIYFLKLIEGQKTKSLKIVISK
jgi:hypothetical protein